MVCDLDASAGMTIVTRFIGGVLQNSSQKNIRLRNFRGKLDGVEKLGHSSVEVSLPVVGHAKGKFELRALVEHLAGIIGLGMVADDVSWAPGVVMPPAGRKTWSGFGAADVQRWVLGPRKSNPLSSVDRSVPTDVSTVDLAAYCLMLGDDALVLSHRLSEWGSRAPELEEDVALASIAAEPAAL